jgi:SIR2-like domain
MARTMMYADVAAAQRYTLVVGAGINARRNVPGWSNLVACAWRQVFEKDPDYRGTLTVRLAEARAAVQKYCGWTKEDAQRLDLNIHPLEPQFALELIDLHLQENPDVADRVRKLLKKTPRVSLVSDTGGNLLPGLLARCLYENVVRSEEPDTLSELAWFVRHSKKLIRVISLNVDNLFELEVEGTRPAKDRKRFLQVISRTRHRPGPGVPIYHLHGFLPITVLQDLPPWVNVEERRQAWTGQSGQDLEHQTEAVPESLVFTDAQYWTSVASPLSFANFVFANALHDSSCIFIGLSMTDLNIIRWLGLHTTEFRTEYEREYAFLRRWDLQGPFSYTRHCWIRTDSSDPSGLLTNFLARRGVYSYALKQWEPKEVRKALRKLL